MNIRKPLGLKIFLFILMTVFLISTPVSAEIKHDAFTIISPVENGEYTVNKPLSISATADKFIETTINGFKASTMNYVIMEISKDDEIRKTSVLRFSTVSGMGYYGVGSTMTSTYTPTETGTYTVRVGFCQYDRGAKLIETGNDKITEVNYLGTYQFTGTEAKPESTNAEDKDNGTGEQPGQQEDSSNASTPSASTTPSSSSTPSASPTPSASSTPSTSSSTPSTSSATTHTAGNITYQLKNNTASVSAPADKNAAKLTVPATVKINGKSVPVTSIAPNAFKGMKKLTTVTIGKNIKTIGKNAFRDCSKLKKITIRTTKLTKKSVGANAFKGISKKAVIKSPKAKKKAYKKILLKKGMKKTMTFK